MRAPRIGEACACGLQRTDQRRVAAIHRRQLRPERHPRRAGERGEIHQQVGLLLAGNLETAGTRDAQPLDGLCDPA